METKKKLSFDEILEAEGAAKHNSDLMNLANDLLAVRNQRRELDVLEKEIMLLVSKVEAGEEQPYEVVKGLHDRVWGIPRAKAR